MRKHPSAMTLALAVSALLAPAQAGAQVPRAFDKAWADVADIFRTRATGEGTVSASLYLIHDGKILRTEYFGRTAAENGKPIDADSIYHWASITKTFTGVAIMQLRDRGLLTLDDPITFYLPEVRKAHNVYGSMDKITLRHLLNHSGGFRASTFPWRGSESWKPHEPAEWSQIEAMMPYTEVMFEPGSKCAYSNLGLSMLGRVVEIVTGDSIESYITKNILMPLGMTRSYFDVTPFYLQADKTHNYFIRDGKLEDRGRELDTGATVANGGLNSPVGDMAKWLNFWADSGDRTNYNTVLSRKSLAEMQAPRCPIDAGDDLDQHMGLTFFAIDYPLASGRTARYVGHTGGQGGYNDYVYVDPATKTAVIFADNTRNTGMSGKDSVYRHTRKAIFETIFPLFAGEKGK